MGKWNGFVQKGTTLNSLGAPATKKKFTAPTLGLEDICFTWAMVSNAARYAEVVDILKDCVAVHFRDEAPRWPQG